MLSNRLVSFLLGGALSVGSVWISAHAAEPKPLKILFLGDNGHHQPAQRARQLIPVLAQRAIEVTYTDQMSALTVENLKRYAGLIIYSNTTSIEPAQESALLEYVAQGGGFIPLHCASYCFLNSPSYIELVGAQFQRHGGEIFATEIVAPDHPLMRGYTSFQSWDETYVHTKHNERNRVVLEVRKQGAQARSQAAEPWTWVRTHGKGRVFYTAWGHDQRTWSNPGFQNLVERGIRWACGDDETVVEPFADHLVFPVPEMTALRRDVAPFEYQDVGPKIPNYPVSERWGVLGDNFSQMQLPLPAAESIKHFTTPKNFHLELFVSEPEIQGKPIAMNWDERGRLWLCETIDYPNEMQPPGQGRDRIRICEDTNGDGRADKFTVFAQQLSVPTAIEFYRGGAIVQAGVETLFLRDTDGDDKADQRETLIAGWAMNDTHGGVSNFQYGLDNRYWAMQGYNDSHPTFAGGRHPGFRQGPFNFTVAKTEKPEVSAVEFVRSTTNNSWGLGISEEGLIFASTANRAPSFFVPIPNRYYERVRGWTASLIADAIFDTHLFQPITKKIRQVDHHGGYTAGAGHALYTARNYPQAWWNRVAFVCGPTGHLVGTFVLSREGATFRDTNAFNLVASDDEWSAPIVAEVGPDGNVWIVDWYNFIVQHNPTPRGFQTGKGNAYESDLRDKKHGRIYRLVYDGAETTQAPAPRIDKAQAESLVAALAHPNRLWRRHAQRLLVERGGKDVVSALVKLIADQSVDAAGLNAGAIHALWTLKGIGALDSTSGEGFAAAVSALRHPSGGVRRNAALVLPPAAQSIQALADSNLIQDADLQARLGAILALADMPEHEAAGKLLAEAARQPSNLLDRWLKEAIICAGAAQASPFLSHLLTANDPSASAPRRGAEASPLSPTDAGTLTAAQRDVVSVLAEHLARGKPNSAQISELLGRVQSGNPNLVQAAIAGLARGWPRDYQPEVTASLETQLDQLVDKLPLAARGQLVRLAGSWGSSKLQKYAAEISHSLSATLANGELDSRQRIEAAAQLLEIAPNDEAPVNSIVALLTPKLPSDVASGFVRSLSGSRCPKVAEALIGRWPQLTPLLRTDAIAVMLTRPESTNQMLDSIGQGTLTISDLSLDQRQTLKNHPDRNTRVVATRLLEAAGGLPSPDRQKVIDHLLASAKSAGDASQGKLIFTKNCANCHKHSGEGQEIGPDLTGMAVHPKEELLVHILDPSRSVEGNFRRYTALTADGKVVAGMLAAESLSAVEMIDGEGKRHSIARSDIEQLSATNKSMMPEGFEAQIQLADMTNLLEFLTSKGRFVPLPLASVATAISTKGLFHEGDNGSDRLIFDDWKPKTFNDVPFLIVDPLGKTRRNIVLLNGPQGTLPPMMPRSVSLPCNMIVKQFHLLSGVSGWGHPASRSGTTSMIVRIHYKDEKTEDHELLNGIHFSDYIRRIDVPQSQFAFRLRNQQIRYLAISPKRREPIATVELLKGNDATAPIVMAVTAEQPQ